MNVSDTITRLRSRTIQRTCVLAGALCLTIGSGCNFYTDYGDVGIVPPDTGMLDAGTAADTRNTDARSTGDVSDRDLNDRDLSDASGSSDVSMDDADASDAGAPGFVAECLHPAGADVRYVAADGGSAGAGTRASPLDLETAILQAEPGDEIVLLSGMYADTIEVTVSGTEDAPIVIRADERHGAVFRLPDGNSVGVRLDDVSHVVVDGLRFIDSSSRWFTMSGASDITISDSRFEGHDGVAVPARVEDSTDVRLVDNRIGGTTKFLAMTVVSVDRFVLEGNHFGVGPGSTIRIEQGSNVIVRGNVFMNPAGVPFQIDATANLLFEQNFVTSSIEGPGSARAAGSIVASNAIIRKNRFVRNWGNALEFNFAADSFAAERLRLYGNVFALNRDESYLDGEGLHVDGGTLFDDLLVFNNLFSNNGGDDFRQLRAENADGSARFLNNHFWHDSAMPTIHYEYQSRSVTATEVEAPSMFDANLAGAPMLDDALSERFVPAAQSPLVDAGRPLARVVGGTSPGSSIDVDDPHALFDGFGMEPGDVIAVGSSDNLAAVVSIDRETGTISLDRQVAFAIDDVVSLPWGGDAPDVGMVELGAVDVAVQRSIYRPQPGADVQLSAIVSASVEPMRMEWRTGDGAIYCERNPTHAWSEPGNYGVRLTIWDTTGAVHRATEVVHVTSDQVDPTALDFALEQLRSSLCDGTAQTYTDGETGLTNVGPKPDGAGYECVQ